MSISTHTNGTAPRAEVGFFEPVFRPVAELAAYIRRYNEHNRAEVQLRSLSDRELADIGIARDQIHARVWQDFDRS